ncbi:hypothetical protein [Geodermatophilus sabuli]|uniref:Uncharacterized protein n=1 Tax=Geodermatophilus sabuli TaxID=1564158 RepID=A0A285ECG4_9ACTN|nr:hypothetical protein [Geodermatophilus sabuli]MBB3084851.1 hypothetical protein [Geodermatophilus sabuli]SNX95741.1 hypothetical protein SAMN06893097_102445 [Geodermatophilus sabuli]
MAARDGSTRDRDTGRGVRSARDGDVGRGSGADRRAATSRRTGPRRPSDRPGPARGPADGLVVGTVPATARLAGALLVLAGLAGVVALFPTYLVVGGQEVAQGGGPGSVLLGLLTPLTSAAVGAGLAAGRVPRFGLGYAGVAGALAVGLLLIELYRADASTTRPGVEVIAGQQVLTSSVEIGAGWVSGVVSLGLTVLAGVLAAVSWGRTVMEDGGALDPARPGLAGLAVLLGVGTVLCLVLPAADVPDRLVTDPATGLQTVVEQDGPQGLLERPGLALLGGLLLAGAVVLCSVLAPSLRPRLAAVGGLLAITAVVLTAGLTGLRDAAVSDELEWTLPGVGLLVAGLGYGVLTVLAWRLRRSAAPGDRP